MCTSDSLVVLTEKRTQSGKSFSRWNDPKYSGYARVSAFTPPVKYLHPWRTHYQRQSQRKSLLDKLRSFFAAW